MQIFQKSIDEMQLWFTDLFECECLQSVVFLRSAICKDCLDYIDVDYCYGNCDTTGRWYYLRDKEYIGLTDKGDAKPLRINKRKRIIPQKE